MSSLWNTYAQILSNPKNWYYSIISNNSHLNDTCDEIFKSQSTAWNWILGYYHDVEKDTVFDGLSKSDHTLHTISTFLLGIHLKDAFSIDTYYPKKSSWLYDWFLTCLFHDAAYSIEHSKRKYPVKTTDLSKFYEKLQINNDNVTVLWNYISSNEKTTNINGEIVRAYYDYCRLGLDDDKKYINHGIVGGLLLYDRLVSLKNNPPANSNRNWKNVDVDRFKRIAESIILHNIWYAVTEEDRERYIKFNKSLLPVCQKGEANRVSYQNPLTNLLIVCDIIEPIKKLNNKSNCACDILSDIDINYSESEKSITIKLLNNKRKFRNWLAKIDLETWYKIGKDTNSNNNTLIYKIL